VSTAIDKQAMLKHQDDAAGIPGVRILPGEESFYREPADAEIQTA